MKCPFCGILKNRVVDSRLSKDRSIIRRRRECLGCKKRFTTYERVEEFLPLIIKKDGRREGYSRKKVIAGIKKAIQKRPISINVIEEFTDQFESEIQEKGEREIPSSFIGEKVMAFLRELDHIAYVRFASVYREFKDINEFLNELTILLKEEYKR